MSTSKAARSEQRLNDHAQLLRILADHMETDSSSVPCLQRSGRDDWTSNKTPELIKAAAACQTCLGLEACRAYADQWETSGAGVWAGKIRGRPNPPEAPPLEPPGVQTIIEQLKPLGANTAPTTQEERKTK